ncbi:MAG TPA: hypothetical protein VMF69_27400 [Gemmataceae bacterium]|nr:hypothetical protein [Gemmataceae bacterium]
MSLEIEQNAMPQRRQIDAADVLETNADEQAGQDPMHNVGVSDDDFPNFLLDAAVGVAKA